MAQTKFKIEGLAELGEALDEMKKATATNVIKRTLMAASDPLVADIEQAAPYLHGHLRRSISAGTKLSRRQKSITRKESRVEVYVGPGALRQAVPQEFGTVHMKPHPFVRPAWERQKIPMLNTIKDLLAQEIEKARARAARKAARLAAKLS